MISTVELIETRCWCGLPHAIPTDLYENAKRTGGVVYCPIGYQWIHREQSEFAKLQSQVASLTLSVQEKDNLLAEERREKERVLKRARRGLCVFCKRTFPNVTAHMRSKHPGNGIKEDGR